MILTRVNLSNFRNLEKIELDVSPRINIFLGRNGQGKTNLLEAMGYLALGRSHRGARDRELIRFGADHLHLAVEGRDGHGDAFRLEAALTPEGHKRIKADGKPLTRNLDLVGRLFVVSFSPGEVDLTKGSPEHRRRFLDYTLSITSGDYFQHLLAYRRALAQKNRLLKARPPASERELDVWDEELVREGVPLLQARAEVLGPLEARADAAYAALAEREGRLRLRLESRTLTRPAGAAPAGRSASAAASGGDEVAAVTPAADRLASQLRAALAAARPRERVVGFCLAGPHRDCLRVELEGRPLRRYGSQGEMRSAAIALKLAQAEVIHEGTRERPVVFLDDIFSELDARRTRALQERLRREHQLFIATARAEDGMGLAGWEEVRAWHVEGGRVTPVAGLEQAGRLLRRRGNAP